MEQAKLTFRADEQCLVKTGGVDKGASKTANYFKAVFDLGANWTEGYDSVKAVWGRGANVYSQVLDGDNSCFIPNELAFTKGEIQVNLVGSVVEGDVLVERLTTFPIIAINITKNVRIEGQETQPITASQFDQYVSITNAGASRAEASAEQAEQSALASAQSAQSASDSAESASQSAQSASQSAEEAEQASQSVLGLTATASVDSSVGTPSVAVTVDTVGDHKVMDFQFRGLKGEKGDKGDQGEKGEQGAKGDTGAKGEDGYSPTVEVTPTEDGHEVTITDKDGEHTFEVLNGTVEDFYPFLPTDSANGAIANFSDGANNVPMLSLIASIDPVQDLHGQDSPYPAGGGKNKFNPDFTNTTINGTTITKLSDGKVTTSGVPTAPFDFVLGHFTLSAGTYILNGAPADGGANKWRLQVTDYPVVTSLGQDNGSGVTFTLASDMEIAIRLQMYVGASSSLTFAPMIRPSSITDPTFAPYSNICPISGWTGAKVMRTGKNLFDLGRFATEYPDNCVYNNGVLSVVQGYSPLYFAGVPVDLPFTTGVVSAKLRCTGNTTNLRIRLAFKDGSIEETNLVNGDSFMTVSRVFTKELESVRFNWSSGGSFEATDFQIELGTTATAYEPYQGQTYNITFPTEAGTVYGGTLDVVSGVLTVDRAMVDLGSLNWTYNATYQMFLSILPGQLTSINKTGICSIYRTLNAWITSPEWGNNDKFASFFANDYYVRIKDTSYSDANDFKTAMVGQTIVYELATPITYQLTPTEVRTLIGDNNIWADTGSTEVTYRADIQKYIDKQISAVLNA